MAFSQFRRFSRNQLLFGGLFRKEIIIRFPRPRDLEVYRVFVMALPANAEESGLAEGMHLESKNDNATESKCTWQAMLRGSTNKYVGYVKSVEEAMAVLREYELETTSKFSCFKSDKMFGAGGKTKKDIKNCENNNLNYQHIKITIRPGSNVELYMCRT